MRQILTPSSKEDTTTSSTFINSSFSNTEGGWFLGCQIKIFGPISTCKPSNAGKKEKTGWKNMFLGFWSIKRSDTQKNLGYSCSPKMKPFQRKKDSSPPRKTMNKFWLKLRATPMKPASPSSVPFLAKKYINRPQIISSLSPKKITKSSTSSKLSLVWMR